MKKFVLHFTIYVFVGLLVFSVAGRIKIHNPLLIGGVEVYHSIIKSRCKKKTKTLILGDSVGRQIYNNYNFNDSIYSLASNQAITLAGQYFLLKDFLCCNDDHPQFVYLIFTPGSLSNDIDEYGYQYFLKPMNTHHYRSMMNVHLVSRIKEVPLSWLSQFPLVKYTNWTPKKHVTRTPCNRLFSSLNLEYLDSIENICNKNDIILHLIAAPSRVSDSNYFCQMAQNENLENKHIEEYIHSMQFFPDSVFVDGTHYYEQFIPDDYLSLVR